MLCICGHMVRRMDNEECADWSSQTSRQVTSRLITSFTSPAHDSGTDFDFSYPRGGSYPAVDPLEAITEETVGADRKQHELSRDEVLLLYLVSPSRD